MLGLKLATPLNEDEELACEYGTATAEEGCGAKALRALYAHIANRFG
jgi:hypothetical protein